MYQCEIAFVFALLSLSSEFLIQQATSPIIPIYEYIPAYRNEPVGIMNMKNILNIIVVILKSLNAYELHACTY